MNLHFSQHHLCFPSRLQAPTERKIRNLIKYCSSYVDDKAAKTSLTIIEQKRCKYFNYLLRFLELFCFTQFVLQFFQFMSQGNNLRSKQNIGINSFGSGSYTIDRIRSNRHLLQNILLRATLYSAWEKVFIARVRGTLHHCAWFITFVSFCLASLSAPSRSADNFSEVAFSSANIYNQPSFMI